MSTYREPFDRVRIVYADDSHDRSRAVQRELLPFAVDVVLPKEMGENLASHCHIPTYFHAAFVSAALNSLTTFPCCGPVQRLELPTDASELLSNLRTVPVFWLQENDHHSYSEVQIESAKRLPIDRHRSIGQHILGAIQKLRPANSPTIVLPLSNDAALLSFVSNPALLQSLDWRSFEKLLAQTLERLDYEVELRSGTNDGGIDLIAIRKDTVFGAHRYLIQAKRYSNSVGVAAVRELLFVHEHERATKSCLVTTSRFTKGAWRLADEYNSRLELRDRDGLMEWIANAIKQAPTGQASKD